MEVMERTQISTPFRVGRVNCYSFAEAGLTVLDPGPATKEAYGELEDFLARIGYNIDDIDRVLLTHPHIDHYGLAGRIVQESDAHVFAHENAIKKLSDPIGYFEKKQEYFRPYLLSMGMPIDMVNTVLQLPKAYTDYQDSVTVTHKLADGDVINVGIDLKCISTPGHSLGSLCFFAASENALFTGDHVLPDITPNPSLTLAPDSNDERTRSLPTYLESLRRILKIDESIGYGGHGDPILTLQNRVQEIMFHHQDRKERIANLIDAHDSMTAYQIMKEMFPELPVTEMFSGMSEVIGHLDLLEDENRVVINEIDCLKWYKALV